MNAGTPTARERALDRLISSMLPQIQAEEARETEARREQLAAELAQQNARFVRDRRASEDEVGALARQLEETRATLRLLEQRRNEAGERLSNMIQSFTATRDRLWAELRAIEDPKITAFRIELRELLDESDGLLCVWPLTETEHQRNYRHATSNQKDVEVRAKYLLEAIDATDRWAQEGLSGKPLDQAIAKARAAVPTVRRGPKA